MNETPTNDVTATGGKTGAQTGTRTGWRRWLALAVMGAVMLVVDQLTKEMAYIHLSNRPPLEVTSFFNLVFVWNPGISFGLFQNDEESGPYFLMAMSLVIMAIMAVWLFRTPRFWQKIAIAAVLAGALGNVIDRARYGAVIDFLDFHAFGQHWPAFNVADSCIVVGIVFLLVDSLFFEPKTDQKTGDT